MSASSISIGYNKHIIIPWHRVDDDNKKTVEDLLLKMRKIHEDFELTVSTERLLKCGEDILIELMKLSE